MKPKRYADEQIAFALRKAENGCAGGLMKPMVASSAALAAVLAFVGAATAQSPGGPVVRTQSGLIAGKIEDGVAAFRGIPYAASTAGALRWTPPRAPAPWTNVRAATAFGPVCPQPIKPWANGETGRQSEDCLSLNIWTPAVSRPGAKLPVMVWLHGGGYTAGAGSQSTYIGAPLANQGAVIVTINYRLGVLGFLAHPALSAEAPDHASGDYGLMDQIAALKWVKDNIAGFGGDPANVTLFGESAGGGSVLLLATSPQAEGLFSKVIVESGAALQLPADGHPAPTLKDGEAAGAALAERLGAHDLKSLRALPVAALVGATSPGAASRPIVDGEVVKTDVTLAYREGHAAGNPMLIGWNSAEGVMFAHPKDTADYEAQVRASAGAAAPAILKLYPPEPAGPALTREAAEELGDTTFGWRGWSVASAQARAGDAPVYVYHFDSPPPRPASSPYRDAGALHSEELTFVWGAPAQANWPAADRAVSQDMQRYWVKFARTGDPNGAGATSWPRFHAGADAQVIWFKDGKAAAGPVPRLAELEALDKAIHAQPSSR